MKNVVVCSSYRSRDGLKSPRAICIYFTRYSNLYSLATTTSKAFNDENDSFKEFTWKTVDFVRCIWIPMKLAIIRKIQNKLVPLIFLDFQTHPQISTFTTGFNYSIKNSIKNFTSRNFSIGILSMSFPASEYWHILFPKIAVHKDFFWYGNC